MRETGIGTSMILIATGAILAFAINVRSTAIDMNTIGAILMVIGIIGLLLSFALMGDWAPWSYGRTTHTDYVDDHVTTPHEHRQVETTDVVYEETKPRVQRVRRVS
jgi:hypothetical protein